MNARVRPATRYLGALTGLRFFAALTVVVGHVVGFWRLGLIPQSSRPGLRAGVEQLLNHLAASGSVAVLLFFVLSGFILAHTYVDGEGKLTTTRRAFYVARFARVYPVYVLGLTGALLPYLRWNACGFDPASVCAASPKPLVVVASLTLTQNWSFSILDNLNSPAWSLSVEALFYLLFPLLAAPLMRLGRWEALTVLALLCALMLAGPLLYTVVQPDGAAGVRHWYVGSWNLWLRSQAFMLLPVFLVGIALGRVFMLEGAAPRDQRWMKALSGDAGAVIALVALAALLFGREPAAPLTLALALMPMALLIYAVAHGRGVLATFLARPHMLLLGEASYALYILHTPVWIWLAHLTHQPISTNVHGRVAPALYALAYIAATIILSLIVFRLVERPARQALRYALSGSVRTPHVEDDGMAIARA